MKKLFILLALTLAVGCVKDSIESVSVEQAQSAKIVRMSDNNMTGSLIICFDEQAISRVESGVSRTGATRSGIDSFDSILDKRRYR